MPEQLEALPMKDDPEPSAEGVATEEPEVPAEPDEPEAPGEDPPAVRPAVKQAPDEPEPPGQGLTPEQFEALLELFDPDHQRAGVIYVEIRGRLARMFERRHCDNPEDLADVTLNRVGRRRAEGAPILNPLAYIHGVANLVGKEFWRQERHKQQVMVTERPADLLSPEDPREDERLDCVRRCLARLPDDQRLLIVRYHDEDDRIQSRRELARELGIAMNALRIRVHRIRRDLEECVRSCLAAQR